MRGLKIVAVVNTKGGVGKTVLTRSLAVAATRPIKRVVPLVAVMDLDPQKNAGRVVGRARPNRQE